MLRLVGARRQLHGGTAMAIICLSLILGSTCGCCAVRTLDELRRRHHSIRAYQCALAFAKRGEYGKAIVELNAAIQSDPNNCDAHYLLGWIHATCVHDAYRDGEKAVLHARRSLASGDGLGCWSVPEFIRIACLAAAYAEVGDFERAVLQQRKAMDEAPEPVKQRLGFCLTLYEEGIALRTAQLSPTELGKISRPLSWIEFPSAEGHFRLLFPGIPERRVVGPDAESRTVVLEVVVEGGRGVFQAYYVPDYPAAQSDPDSSLSRAQQSLIGRFKAAFDVESVDKQHTTFQGRSARITTIVGTDADLKFTYHAIQLVAGRRLYVWSVTAEQGAVDQAAIDKFLFSFRLLNATGGNGQRVTPRKSDARS